MFFIYVKYARLFARHSFDFLLYILQNSWVSVAEFIDPDWEDKVNSGIGLSPRLHELVGQYDNPMPELTLSPSQGSMNSATAGQQETYQLSKHQRAVNQLLSTVHQQKVAEL